jgi:hypothetical protein
MFVDAAVHPRGICRSWPHCRAVADAPEGRFCIGHQQALDRVQAVLNPRLYRALGKDEAALPPAEMVIRHVEPATSPKAKRKRTDWSAVILGALAAGSLASGALAEVCGVSTQDRTFARQRLALLNSGRIIVVPGKPGRGSGSVFGLPPAAEAVA